MGRRAHALILGASGEAPVPLFLIAPKTRGPPGDHRQSRPAGGPSHPTCGNVWFGRGGGSRAVKAPILGIMAGTLALSQEQECSVRAALDRFSLRDKALAELLLGSGYRVTEALSLTVVDVWSNGKVRTRATVRRAHMKGGRSPWRRSVTARSVPLNARVVAALEAFLFSRFGSAGPANPYEPLFQSRSGGGRLSRWRVNQLVHEILEAAGIDARSGTGLYGTHSLRKTFCTNVYRISGNNIALARIAMSHSSVQTTQAYLPVAAEEVDRVVMALGAEELPSAAVQEENRLGG